MMNRSLNASKEYKPNNGIVEYATIATAGFFLCLRHPIQAGKEYIDLVETKSKRKA